MTKYQHSIGRDKAIALAKTRWWNDKTPHQIVAVALFTQELCCDFHVLHEALEEALERPVFTHELANIDGLCAEFLGERPAPTMEQILAMVPADKLVVVRTES